MSKIVLLRFAILKVPFPLLYPKKIQKCTVFSSVFILLLQYMLVLHAYHCLLLIRLSDPILHVGSSITIKIFIM